MDELIKRLERVITTGVPDKNGQHPISAEVVLDVVKQLQTAELGTDCISRQAAIDAVVFECGEWMGLASEISKQLRRLPSAQPKRIRGKWVGADTQCGIACSVCGVAVDDFCYSADYIDLDYEPNFCPNCGADMRGEQDG